MQKEEIDKLNHRLKLSELERRENMPHLDLTSSVVNIQITEKEPQIEVELTEKPEVVEETKHQLIDLVQEIQSNLTLRKSKSSEELSSSSLLDNLHDNSPLEPVH